MRNFTSVVPASMIQEFSWCDFASVKFSEIEVGSNLHSFGIKVSGYILTDCIRLNTSRLGDYSLENAANVAFFMAHSSKYASFQDWTLVRAWFGDQTPAVQATLVKARIWFQQGVRQMSTRPKTEMLGATLIVIDKGSFGALVLADLNTGAVVMAMHVDHSDC